MGVGKVRGRECRAAGAAGSSTGARPISITMAPPCVTGDTQPGGIRESPRPSPCCLVSALRRRPRWRTRPDCACWPRCVLSRLGLLCRCGSSAALTPPPPTPRRRKPQRVCLMLRSGMGTCACPEGSVKEVRSLCPCFSECGLQDLHFSFLCLSHGKKTGSRILATYLGKGPTFPPPPTQGILY
jgi:hypothetical protein